MKISEITSNLNSITIVLLIKRVIQGVTNNNSPYLNLTLQDATGTINARMWDVKPKDIATLKSGKVINVNANSLSYNNEIQLKINSYTLVNDETVIDSLLISAPIDVNAEWQMIIDTISNFNDQVLRDVLLTILQQNQALFTVHPAAIKMHHSSRNGLLWHTATMLKMAKMLVEVYADREINRDLVYAGVIMHDFGKLQELSSHFVASFTLQGQLKGHIVLGSEAISVACKQLKIDLVSNKTLILLQHIILSSHGKYEFGSPVLPKILEAEIVHQLDNLDARITIVNDALQYVKTDETTARLIALENRAFLRHYQK